jgi:hypothetical protein
MGYSTDFSGKFDLNKKLDKETHEFLVKFSQTRRMARNVDPKYGEEGEFFVDGKELMGRDEDDTTVINYNRPPKTQPGLWCTWYPLEDGLSIECGDGKVYDYIEWIKYLIKKILAPKGYILNGKIKWQGEDIEDRGEISIKNNVVKVKELE